MATFQWAGFDKLTQGLRQIQHADAAPLMSDWCKIIEEDNRRGVLAGLDKDGNPMAPVTYRPVADKPTKWTKRHQDRHLASAAGPVDNNLTSSQYRKLGGPPLAPRGANSRVITNLQTGFGYDSANDQWFAEGAWFDVVGRDGKEFLHSQLEGKGRDLRGVRPEGRQKAVAAMLRWGKRMLGGLFGTG